MNKVKKIVPGIILVDTILLDLLYAVSVWILHHFGIAFRKWFLILIIIISVIGLIVGVFQLIIKIKKRGLKILMIIAAVAAIPFFGYYGLIAGIFVLSDVEHVVEKDGKKYVAYVRGFLDTDVNYYEYKSFLTCGDTKRIQEYYGEGGFDPLKEGSEMDPLRIILYDEEGNVISIENHN